MKDRKGITLIALVITIIILLILAGIAISMLSGENGILKKVRHSSQAQRATYIQEQINLTIYENKIKEYSSGEFITRKALIKKLVNDGNLKPREAAILDEKDIIEIDGIMVDFSELNSTILITPNNLLIETKEDGTFETKELKAELKNISGKVTWEIVSGTEYISLQGNEGENITVKAKANGICTGFPCTAPKITEEIRMA